MTGVARIFFLNGKNSESVAIDALFFCLGDGSAQRNKLAGGATGWLAFVSANPTSAACGSQLGKCGVIGLGEGLLDPTVALFAFLTGNLIRASLNLETAVDRFDAPEK